MELVHDYIHPTPGEGCCRVRLYLPDEAEDSPVVILSELRENTGRSVTDAASRIAAEIISGHGLEDPPPVFIEHYPAFFHPPDPDTFDLVTFEDYRFRETSDIDGWAWSIGPPKWRPFDRDRVEALVGQPVED